LLFFALFKRVIVRSLFLLLLITLFVALFKRAIVQSLFLKEQLCDHSFYHSFEKNNHAIVFEKEQMSKKVQIF